MSESTVANQGVPFTEVEGYFMQAVEHFKGTRPPWDDFDPTTAPKTAFSIGDLDIDRRVSGPDSFVFGVNSTQMITDATRLLEECCGLLSKAGWKIRQVQAATSAANEQSGEEQDDACEKTQDQPPALLRLILTKTVANDEDGLLNDDNTSFSSAPTGTDDTHCISDGGAFFDAFVDVAYMAGWNFDLRKIDKGPFQRTGGTKEESKYESRSHHYNSMAVHHPHTSNTVWEVQIPTLLHVLLHDASHSFDTQSSEEEDGTNGPSLQKASPAALSMLVVDLLTTHPECSRLTPAVFAPQLVRWDSTNLAWRKGCRTRSWHRHSFEGSLLHSLLWTRRYGTAMVLLKRFGRQLLALKNSGSDLPKPSSAGTNKRVSTPPPSARKTQNATTKAGSGNAAASTFREEALRKQGGKSQIDPRRCTYIRRSNGFGVHESMCEDFNWLHVVAARPPLTEASFETSVALFEQMRALMQGNGDATSGGPFDALFAERTATVREIQISGKGNPYGEIAFSLSPCGAMVTPRLAQYNQRPLHPHALMFLRQFGDPFSTPSSEGHRPSNSDLADASLDLFKNVMFEHCYKDSFWEDFHIPLHTTNRFELKRVESKLSGTIGHSLDPKQWTSDYYEAEEFQNEAVPVILYFAVRGLLAIDAMSSPRTNKVLRDFQGYPTKDVIDFALYQPVDPSIKSISDINWSRVAACECHPGSEKESKHFLKHEGATFETEAVEFVSPHERTSYYDNDDSDGRLDDNDLVKLDEWTWKWALGTESLSRQAALTCGDAFVTHLDFEEWKCIIRYTLRRPEKSDDDEEDSFGDEEDDGEMKDPLEDLEVSREVLYVPRNASTTTKPAACHPVLQKAFDIISANDPEYERVKRVFGAQQLPGKALKSKSSVPSTASTTRPSIPKCLTQYPLAKGTDTSELKPKKGFKPAGSLPNREYVPFVACPACGLPGYAEHRYHHLIPNESYSLYSCSHASRLQDVGKESYEENELMKAVRHFMLVAKMRETLALAFRLQQGSLARGTGLSYDVIALIGSYLLPLFENPMTGEETTVETDFIWAELEAGSLLMAAPVERESKEVDGDGSARKMIFKPLQGLGFGTKRHCTHLLPPHLQTQQEKAEAPTSSRPQSGTVSKAQKVKNSTPTVSAATSSLPRKSKVATPSTQPVGGSKIAKSKTKAKI